MKHRRRESFKKQRHEFHQQKLTTEFFDIFSGKKTDTEMKKNMVKKKYEKKNDIKIKRERRKVRSNKKKIHKNGDEEKKIRKHEMQKKKKEKH